MKLWKRRVEIIPPSTKLCRIERSKDIASIVTSPDTSPVSDANLADNRPKNFNGIGRKIAPIRNDCIDGSIIALAAMVPSEAMIAVLDMNISGYVFFGVY